MSYEKEIDQWILKELKTGEKDMKQLVAAIGINDFGLSPFMRKLQEEEKILVRKERAKKFYSIKK